MEHLLCISMLLPTAHHILLHLQDLKDSSVQGLLLSPFFFGQKCPLSASCLGGKWICSSGKKNHPRTHEMEILQWMFAAVV